MVYYAGGGGGGNDATGGSGIGGNGSSLVASAGAVNTGSGGGGGYNHTGGNGGAGGSGVVIISYAADTGMVATGGSITTVGGKKIHRFTSSSTFTVTSLGSASCPSSPSCSVLVDGNVRSSFTVPKPTVDSDGKALTIPNSGYVEVTRTSNGAVWRTYKQPSVQAAVVPDLCSGNATAARGWASAARAATQNSIAGVSTAETITLASGPINTGVMYFRKDFNVTRADTYNLSIHTPSSQDVAEVYIDGKLNLSTAGSLATGSLALGGGCHTIVVKLTNIAVDKRASAFTTSIVRNGATTPVVVSNDSWRVGAGDPVHYSTANYFEAPGMWEEVVVRGSWNNAAVPWAGNPTNWYAVSGDIRTQWITTRANGSGSTVPANQYALFRDTQTFTLNTVTDVRVSNYCDDRCDIYLDGDLSFTSTGSLVSRTITVQPGTHTFGIRVFNGGAAGYSAFLFSAVDLSDNSVLANSNPGWDTTTSWSAAAIDSYSYDTSYVPVPAVTASIQAKVLVVGGGGGGGSDMGGGGGGGGVQYDATHSLTAGSYTVTVGAGGSGAPAGVGQARGANGGNSTFDTMRAYGGGGGGSEYSTNASPPGSGASAGGTAGCNQNTYAAPVISQGSVSAGTIGCYYPTGGGGAGGPGSSNPATGGVGVSNSILGTAYFFGGGGGGSGYSGNGGNGGNGGGAGGPIGVITTGGSGLNAGGNGKGGATVAQSNVPGSNGGANTGGGGSGGSHYNANNYGGNGGSGIVIIAIPTGSVAITAPSAVITTSGGYTIYRFNTSSTFVVGGAPSVRALVVAGGGGGAGNCNTCGGAGGGGAGGLLYEDEILVSLGSTAITVGAGGAGGAGINSAAGKGAKGNNSAFGSLLVAVGGGGGSPQDGTAGGIGGSGGGGGGGGSPPPGGAGGGTYGQGNAGVAGTDASLNYRGGGGGGAGAAGSANNGGAGATYTIRGASATYAGGGGGGAYTTSAPGSGGSGGGGAGANQSINSGKGYAGVANTGGGGGGANGSSLGGVGGAGGSGIVVLSYPVGALTATGGTITTAGGRTIHTFTSSGVFTITAFNL